LKLANSNQCPSANLSIIFQSFRFVGQSTHVKLTTNVLQNGVLIEFLLPLQQGDIMCCCDLRAPGTGCRTESFFCGKHLAEPQKMTLASVRLERTALHSLSVNNNGRTCQRGATNSIEKKIQVAVTYERLKEASGGSRPMPAQVVSDCAVSRNFVRKIESELVVHGKVLHPKELPQNRMTGPGARAIDEMDAFVLLLVCLVERSRTLPNCDDCLFLLTGTQVLESTIV
jgi:hypothetical protein